ncbi:PorT family protein [Flavihumibacter sp. RY-1]|uniref:PorT family protein n=1 Tax=Flavihumibacter fluminis TaxID=2909236 RepID=A0ABS9BIX8_9BACT|nr:porin family protein [Flavihumibacter fluminis]MCF1715576.1 PorT family protein [Flavihumibacter fluminis]
MKKSIRITLAALTISGSVIAQDNLSLGGTAGFGHTWLSNSTNSRYQPAGNLGLSLTYSTETNWGFGADLKWSIEGGKTSTSNLTSTTRLDYVRVPLKLMYFFGERGNAFRPKLTVGPSVGFLIGGKNEATTIAGDTKTTVETKASDFAKSVDLGVAASAGFNYRLVERTWLNVDLNYYHGLTDIMEAASIDQKNRNIGINVGVSFGIGKVQ